MIQIADFATQAEQRAVHHPQDFTRQRGIVFDAFLERSNIDLRLLGQLQHLERDGGEAVKLPDAFRQVFDR